MLYHHGKKKLSVIVPFRDREEHLQLFLPTIKKCLIKQDIDFKIHIIEQEKGKPFNKGKLLNVGFLETKFNFDYFVFHDVDMLPDRIDYSYQKNPAHLACCASQFNYAMPYSSYFGGVFMFTVDTFSEINGASNEYWGWGAEDDDIYYRCLHSKLEIVRPETGRFESLNHERNIDTNQYEKNCQLLKNMVKRIYDYKSDGLNNCDYKILEKKDENEFVRIKVSI